MSWIVYGLRGGILTTRYPWNPDRMPSAYRGAAEAIAGAHADDAARGAQACLSGAAHAAGDGARVDMRRCFQCGQCARTAPQAFRMRDTFELAEVDDDPQLVRARLAERARAWGRSVHLRHVDAGSDGSEEQELQAIFNPFYDANRLGIFLTAAPRHADVLVVSGVVTKPMERPLRRAYDAMPEPKSVIALGTSACSGGIFAGSDAVVGPVHDVVPVDVYVPGAPPSPLTILHALWVVLGRAPGGRSTQWT